MALNFKEIRQKKEYGDAAKIARITGKSGATVSRCINEEKKADGTPITTLANRRLIHSGFIQLFRARDAQRNRRTNGEKEYQSIEIMKDENTVINKFNLSCQANIL